MPRKHKHPIHQPPTAGSRAPDTDGSPPASGRSRWMPPELIELPPLTELTLQTGGPIGGGGDTGGGGSTVF